MNNTTNWDPILQKLLKLFQEINWKNKENQMKNKITSTSIEVKKFWENLSLENKEKILMISNETVVKIFLEVALNYLIFAQVFVLNKLNNIK